MISQEVQSIDPDTEFRKLLAGCPKIETALPERQRRQSEYARKSITEYARKSITAGRRESTFMFF